LQKRLSKEDGLSLMTLLERAQKRWPSQDTAESMEEYLADYEKLALKYSLQTVIEAIDSLRLSDLHFFPKPDDVVEMIQAKAETNRYDFDIAQGKIRRSGQDEYRAKLFSAEEIAWRKSHFGYDPYTEKEPAKSGDSLA
jgi:hypothetical protein